MLCSLHSRCYVFHLRGKRESKKHNVVLEVICHMYLLQWDHALSLPLELPEELCQCTAWKHIYGHY